MAMDIGCMPPVLLVALRDVFVALVPPRVVC